MTDVSLHKISPNRETACQHCHGIIDRGDVYGELLTDAGRILACQPCTERRISDLDDRVPDPPHPPLA